MRDVNIETLVGFGLVAFVLGAGIAMLNATIIKQVGKVNTSIQGLPESLKRTVLGG